MDRIRRREENPRSFAKDLAELPRQAHHSLLTDRSQNLRQPRRHRRLPPQTPNFSKKRRLIQFNSYLRTKSSQIIINFAPSTNKANIEIDEAKQILTRVRRVSDVILSKKE